MVLEALEQLGGLLQAGLPDAQVGQPDDRGLAPRRAPPVELPGRLEQLDLRLVPAAGRREDAAVMGTAERGHDVAPPPPLGGGTDPLVRAGDVVDQLAPPEEAAEDLVHGGELGQLAGQQRRHRLVAQRQPLLDAVDHQVHAAEVGHGQELDVGVTDAASDRDRLAGQGLAHLRVRFREGPDQQHPAALRPILARLLEDGAGARQPSAADGPVAQDVAGDPGDRARRPAGGHEVALPAEGGVGALVARRRPPGSRTGGTGPRRGPPGPHPSRPRPGRARTRAGRWRRRRRAAPPGPVRSWLSSRPDDATRESTPDQRVSLPGTG